MVTPEKLPPEMALPACQAQTTVCAAGCPSSAGCPTLPLAVAPKEVEPWKRQTDTNETQHPDMSKRRQDILAESGWDT